MTKMLMGLIQLHRCKYWWACILIIVGVTWIAYNRIYATKTGKRYMST